MAARHVVRWFAGLALAIAGATSAHAQQRTVNFYNWSNYVAPGVLDDFTKETGIKVVYDTFDANETLETRLLAGKSGYDVVVPSAYFLQRQIGAGIFQKLDKTKLSNLVNAWPEVTAKLAIYDPGNVYAVNYMWGTTGIGYNVKAMQKVLGADAQITSWATVFDPANLAKFKDCGVQMLDSADDILPAALNYLGLDPNSTKQADLDKAAEVIGKIRPFVRKFHSSEYLNGLATGEICLVVGWSGDIKQAQKRDGSQQRCRDWLCDPERGRADVLRQPVDPDRCEERRGSLRVDRLFAAPGSGGEEFQFPVLCQRQSRQPEADRSESAERQDGLSRSGYDEPIVRHHRARSGDATYHQPLVDAG